jgi:hypothetical protein
MASQTTEDEPRHALRHRFWAELAMAAIALVLFLLTLSWQDWIEALGVKPDGGDGSLEWVIVAGLALLALASTMLACTEWKRPPTGEATAR